MGVQRDDIEREGGEQVQTNIASSQWAIIAVTDFDPLHSLHHGVPSGSTGTSESTFNCARTNRRYSGGRGRIKNAPTETKHGITPARKQQYRTELTSVFIDVCVYFQGVHTNPVNSCVRDGTPSLANANTLS